MADHWLLIETFGGDNAPSVIGVGTTPKRMVPLRTVLCRGRFLTAVEEAVTDTLASGQSGDHTIRDGQHRVVREPLISFRGHVHGVWVWVGGLDQEPPPRDLAGAWHFNLTTDTIGGSHGLLDLYGVPKDQRQTERATAEAFTRLIPNIDSAQAMALLVRSRPGDEHQAVWAIRRDDAEVRAGHLSCRAILEPTNEGPQVVLRGITHDIGPADATPAAPPPAILEHRVLESMAQPGEHRALVNLTTLRILRWIDDPLPDLHWTHDPNWPDRRWIHPDDLPDAQRLSDSLPTGRSTGHLRLARMPGGWLDVDIIANIVLLDQHTTAGLFTFSLGAQP